METRFHLKPSTRKLIARLRLEIKAVSTTRRVFKTWARTPSDQRSLLSDALRGNTTLYATLLCAVRAEMRGRIHQPLPEGKRQATWIRETLQRVQETAKRLGPVYADPVFQPWRCTMILAALEAAVVERIRREMYDQRCKARPAA